MMRVLMVVLALAITPFVAGVAQSANGSNCDNGQGDEHRSAQGTANAHRGVCAQPPAPTCPASAALSLGTASISGSVYNATTGAPLGGWCIHVTGTASASVQSDPTTGMYLLSGLPAGTYTICEDVQSGWQESFPGSWSQTTCANGTYGWTFSVVDGARASYVNFGNVTAP